MTKADRVLITEEPLLPTAVINRVKDERSGCVVTYVGVIRGDSQGEEVLAVEYRDPEGTAEEKLQKIGREIRQRWPVNNIALCHRIGKLKVGEINLVVAIASAHRQEGFAACQYAIDAFKQNAPTQKIESYKNRKKEI